MSLPIDIFSWRLHYPGLFTNRSWCYKTFFWGNLDFPKFKKLKKVCSDVWTCTKMWEQCYFQAKLYSNAVYCFEKGLFLQFWLKVKSRFSRFPPKKSFITLTTGGVWEQIIAVWGMYLLTIFQSVQTLIFLGKWLWLSW